MERELISERAVTRKYVGKGVALQLAVAGKGMGKEMRKEGNELSAR